MSIHDSLAGNDLVARAAKLDDLRARLTRNQCDILNAIWRYYLEHDKWIPSRVLHHEYSKATVQSALEQLGGSIVFESAEIPKAHYQLTFLGILLTEQGEEYQKMLVQYLEYVREKFGSNPEIEMVSNQELDAAMHLTQDQSRLLGQLITRSPFWGGSSSQGSHGWSVSVPRDVEDLSSVPDLGAYVRAYVLKDFDPDVPVSQNERVTYSLTKGTREKPPDEFGFVRESGLQQLLAADWQEAQTVYSVSAWKSCVILCGGILEGLLLDALGRDTQRAEEVYSSLRKKSPPDLSRWDLSDVVDVSEEMSILSKGTIHLGNALRLFRNLIHPGRQMREKVDVTEDEASIALSAVRICVRELASRDYGRKQHTRSQTL